MTAIAAIDVGSNAIRLAIGSLDNNNQLFVVENFREPIRLGQEVFSVGALSEETIERVVSAFQHFRNIIDHQQVKKVRAVATSALREATNRDVLIERVQKRANITIEVIPGTEEARLVAEAVRTAVDLKNKLAMLIDIGGGSIEISVLNDGDIVSFNKAICVDLPEPSSPSTAINFPGNSDFFDAMITYSRQQL